MSSAAHVAAGLPLGFLGLPSVQSIVEAIANGFAQALAGALVPGFLKHAGVASIQWLVALPDPGSWTHVDALEGQMAWLGFSLMPVTLAVSAIRYWTMGLTGSAHPAGAVARCVGSCGLLVAYPWVVGQAVAAANTLTHAILGFPEVAGGLSSLVSVLFGGALLTGGGTAFLAILVIVGVVFAGALFAMQAFLTLLLCVLVVAGPPLIAVSPVPELAHLARGWARALGVVCLIPVCWTVLFAVAGALTLDATDVEGGAGGVPGHVIAAFAALAVWVLAVRLPMMLLGELRGFLAGGLRRGAGGGAGEAGGGGRGLPGAEQLRLAHARLRSVALDGVPAVAASAGAAAGALGAPSGGPVGAARRRLRRAVARSGDRSGGAGGVGAGGAVKRERPAVPGERGLRGRLAQAGRVAAEAPGLAREAVASGTAEQMRGGSQADARPQPPGQVRAKGSGPGRRSGRGDDGGRQTAPKAGAGLRSERAASTPKVPLRRADADSAHRSAAGFSPATQAGALHQSRPAAGNQPREGRAAASSQRTQAPETRRQRDRPRPASMPAQPEPAKRPQTVRRQGNTGRVGKRAGGAQRSQRAKRNPHRKPKKP